MLPVRFAGLLAALVVTPGLLVTERAVETLVGAVIGIAVVVAVRAPRKTTVSGVAAART